MKNKQRILLGGIIACTTIFLFGACKKDNSMILNDPHNIHGVISYKRSFPDLNATHMKAAKTLGIRPISSRKEAERSIGRLEKITGEKYSALHVVGGGSKDAFLARITADATGKEVLAGPSEATAAGNALAQLIALGEISDLAAARKTVARNSEIARFYPNAADYYDEKFSKFEKLTEEV